MLTITYSQVCRMQGPVLCRPSKMFDIFYMQGPVIEQNPLGGSII